MGNKTKISRYEILEARLIELEIKQSKDAEMMSDLLDYLMRVDANFVNNSGTFEGWYMRLMQLRNEEKKRQECAQAQAYLEDQGYIVAADPSGLDAARVKKWVSTKVDDDDSPF